MDQASLSSVGAVMTASTQKFSGNQGRTEKSLARPDGFGEGFLAPEMARRAAERGPTAEPKAVTTATSGPATGNPLPPVQAMTAIEARSALAAASPLEPSFIASEGVETDPELQGTAPLAAFTSPFAAAESFGDASLMTSQVDAKPAGTTPEQALDPPVMEAKGADVLEPGMLDAQVSAATPGNPGVHAAVHPSTGLGGRPEGLGDRSPTDPQSGRAPMRLVAAANDRSRDVFAPLSREGRVPEGSATLPDRDAMGIDSLGIDAPGFDAFGFEGRGQLGEGGTTGGGAGQPRIEVMDFRRLFVEVGSAGADSTLASANPDVTNEAGSAAGAPGFPLGLRETGLTGMAQQTGVLTVPLKLQGDFQDGLMQRFQFMLGAEVQAARVIIDPPELGALDIRIAIQGGEAQVQLTAQQAATRDMLEQALPRLRELFEQAGLTLGGADIRHGTDTSAGHAGRGGAQEGVWRRQGDAEGASAESLIHPARRVMEGYGLLDVYA